MKPPVLRSRARVAATLVFLTAAAAAAVAPRRAAANGAFPDSQAVLVPADRPHQLVLATNFGLIRSENDGALWTWACEQDPMGARDLYQFTQPPRHRLLARDVQGLVYTDDGGCSWHDSSGSYGDGRIVDAFPDPNDAERVLGVVAPADITTGVYTVYESTDGGTTFPTLRYTAQKGDTLNGIEISRSDPKTVYVTLLRGATFLPHLLRSTNGGQSWTDKDLSTTLGAGSVLLIAIDPQNPMRVFLRVNASTANKLAITPDAGATLAMPLVLNDGFMTGFTRLPDGTMLVSGMMGISPVLYRSKNDGASFESLPNAPKLWGLSQRGGKLYGAGQTDEVFAVGTSADQGATWTSLLHYSEVKAIDACAATACADSCDLEVQMQLWPEEVCTTPAPPGSSYNSSAPAGDGGTDTNGGGGTSGAGGAGGSTGVGGASGSAGRGGSGGASGTGGNRDGGTDGTGGSGGKSGCGCAVPAHNNASWLVFASALIAIALRVRRKSRRK